MRRKSTKRPPAGLPTTRDLSSAPEALLTDREVAGITRRKRSTLQKDRMRGDGIPFIRLGRLVRYRASAVDAWIASRPTFHSTSEAAEMGKALAKQAR
jgi:predicted DNA-binding transcriptional regulator AlpA